MKLPRPIVLALAGALCAAWLLPATAAEAEQPAGPVTQATTAPVPYDHVVVVMLENKNFGSVIDSDEAPYLSSLATRGATMTQSYGVTHPSQPNYVALFSGDQHGVTSNACPVDLSGTPNLGQQLLDAGRTFTGYAESLPQAGFTGCESPDKLYARKHNSWVDFGLPASTNQPFTAFPSDYSQLPTVAFVSPNLCHDMHNAGCLVPAGDAWMEDNLDAYATWATTHNSLLVVTFDENESGTMNSIPTLFVGDGIRRGASDEWMNHYTLLRTLENLYGLPSLVEDKPVTPLSTIWADEPPGVVNGGFEDGLAKWVLTGTTATAHTVRHGGSLTASAGGHTPTKGDSEVAQIFTVPRGRSTLSLVWRGDCEDTLSKAWAKITLRDRSTGAVTSVVPRTCVRNGSWTKAKIAVTEHRAYTIRLVSHDDGKKGTPNITYLDDVKLS